jgi:hypothetical protein
MFEVVYEVTSRTKTRLVSLVSNLFNMLIGWSNLWKLIKLANKKQMHSSPCIPMLVRCDWQGFQLANNNV